MDRVEKRNGNKKKLRWLERKKAGMEEDKCKKGKERKKERKKRLQLRGDLEGKLHVNVV